MDAPVVGSYTATDDLAPDVHFTLSRCPRCSAPFLTQLVDMGFGDDTPEPLYPTPDRQLSDSVPENIAKAFNEARSCFRGRNYTASAIMCRKAVEGICVAHEVRASNLASSLRALKDQGIIDSRLFDWANALRISGNEAAHDVEVSVSAQDASDILDFTHALIEYLFTFRDRFTEFMARRAR